MRVFVTGATGYIGSVVTEKLLAAGHEVLGLARSDSSARKLERLGAQPVPGDMGGPAVVSAAARRSEAVIHLAAEFSPNGPQLDRAVIDAVLEAFRGSGKAFVYTSGIWVMGSTGGRVADESAPVNPVPLVAWRPSHEQSVLKAEGVRGIVIRPGMVYGRSGGFLASLFVPGRNGAVRIVGSGENRWSFVHVDDLADLYVLALQAPTASLYFATAGPAVPVAELAKAAALGATVEKVPLDQARAEMGPVADALALDGMFSSLKAMRELGWKPARASVLQEFNQRGAEALET
jgi:nucleoside-diphosphate-sugar epimerase